MPTTMPGVFALIKNGIATYRSRFNVIFTIALLEVALIGLFLLVAKVGGLTLFFAGGIVYVIGLLYISIALLHAIRGASENVSIGEAFTRAGRHVVPILWVAVLMILIMFGSIALCALLPGVILLMLGLQYVAFAVAIILMLVVMVVIGTWFCFTNFIVIDDAGRGIEALAKSRAMVMGHFMPVFGRIFGLTFLLGLVIGICSALVRGILGSIGVGPEVEGLSAQAITSLIFTPVLMGAIYSLYTNVRGMSTAPADTRSLRTWVIVIAVAALLAIIATPFVFSTYIAPYTDALKAKVHSTELPTQMQYPTGS